MAVCKVQQYTTGQESQQELVLTKRDQQMFVRFLSVLATLLKTLHGMVIYSHQMMISFSSVHDG